MANRRLASKFSTIVLAMVVAVFLSASAGADPPSKKRVKKGSATPQKARATHDQRAPTPHKARAADGQKKHVRRAHPTKTYVRTSRDYGHVRIAHPHRHDNGSIIVRPIIARSARVTPVVLHRLEDRRRNQIQLVIKHFHSGDHASALHLWGSFVAGLVDYHEPIDLDEVMLLIAPFQWPGRTRTLLFGR